MSIENFFTIHTSTGQGKHNMAAGSGVGAPLDITADPSALAFMELFLQQLENSEATKKQKEAGEALLASNNPVLSQDTSLTETEELFSSIDAKITEAIELNQETLENGSDEAAQKAKDILNALLLEDKNSSKPKLHMVQDLLGQIEALITAKDPALINTNLTPAQIQNIQTEVDKILAGESTAKDSAERLAKDGVFAGLVTLTEPQKRTGALFLAQSLSGGKNSNGLKPANDLSHTLGSVTHDGSDLPTDIRFQDFLKNLAEGNLGNHLKNLENAAAKSGQNNIVPLQDAGVLSLQSTADASSLQGWPFSMSGSLLSSLSGAGSYDDMGLAGVSNGQVTNLSGLTNLVTQAQSATQPHPGTQMVAATIKKAAGGEKTNITLQLDPPELGRVEVRMNLSKEKHLKTKITVEKPETLAMLQRDVTHLERALQGSGLDTDAGIEFELASEDYAFSQDGRHDEHHSGQKGNGQNENEDEMEILETTMTWSVDPETGHARYNIWA